MTHHLGDYVTANGEKGRVHKIHVMGCPESPQWLAIQQLLGPDPHQYKDGPWVSFLVHGGGAITVPDREEFITTIDPFPFENPWADVYFGD